MHRLKPTILCSELFSLLRTILDFLIFSTQVHNTIGNLKATVNMDLSFINIRTTMTNARM